MIAIIALIVSLSALFGVIIILYNNKVSAELKEFTSQIKSLRSNIELLDMRLADLEHTCSIHILRIKRGDLNSVNEQPNFVKPTQE
jgi:uncharacterized protein YoxC